MRTIRLFLLVLMLACLPLQSWASTAVHAVSDGPAASAAGFQAPDDPSDLAVAAIAAEDGAPGDTPSDSADPWQAGADLAEQLLPARAPRLAAGNGRSALPRYAAGPLPEPDLPLPPRPPRG